MTGNNTDVPTKLRAVFLAFIMVMSVFGATVAFSGSVAADSHFNTTVYVDLGAGSGGDGSQGNPYNNIQAAIDDVEDTSTNQVQSGSANARILVKNSTAGQTLTAANNATLAFSAARTGDVALETENGTSAVTLKPSSGPIVDISASVNVTVRGFTIDATDAAGVNAIDGPDGEANQLTTVDNNVIKIDGTDTFAIQSGSQTTVTNNQITSSGGEPYAVKVFNQPANGSVIRGNTFDGLDFGVQASASDVTIENNDFKNIDEQSIILNTGSTSDITAATIVANNFSNVGAGIFLTEDVSGVINNQTAEGLYVARNNFKGLDGDLDNGAQLFIDTATAPLSGYSDGSITGTIYAEENYYGTAAGPRVDGDEAADTTDFTPDGDSTDPPARFDQRNYNSKGAPIGATVSAGGDIQLVNWLDAPYPNEQETLNFDNSFAVDQQTTDDLTRVNVTLPAANGNNVNESSVDVLLNNNDGNNDAIKVVENGELQQDALSAGQNEINVVESTLDGTNDSVEYIRLNVSLKESTTGYDLVANATDTASSPNSITTGTITSSDGITGTELTEGDGVVDMTGQQIKLTPDSSNPFALNDDGTTAVDEAADLRVIVADQYGNNLTDTASSGLSVNGAEDIALTTQDSSVSISGAFDAQSGTATQSSVPIEGSNPAYFNVTDTEAETVSLKALDVGSPDPTLSSATVEQQFSPRVGGLTAGVNRTSLPADDSTQSQISVQLTDGNGNPVPRAGTTVAFSVDNSSDAGVTRKDASPITTNNNGVATLNITADTSGVPLDVTAIEQSTGNGFTATTSLETVPGNIDTAASTFELNNLGDDTDLAKSAGVQVATEHSLTVTLVDGQGNAVPSVPVEFSANKTGASFSSASTTTNDTGVATTTVTLPQQKGSTRLNVSAGDFNASALGSASINATTNAANASALQFASDSRVVPASTEDTGVSIEVVDQFGNVNASVGDTVTLESSDANVFDFDGSASSDVALSGSADFKIDANSSGTATLSATVADADISNTSAEFSVGQPSGVAVTFTSDVSTSSNANTNSTATLTAQLLDANGGSIGVADEKISFARQSGDAAELDQSASPFENKTNANGVATFQVNATDTTGDTGFLALADNFSAQGTGTITTTGAASTVGVAPANSTVAPGNETTVTVTFEDSQGRTVPRTEDVTLQADDGEVDGSGSASNTTTFVNGAAQATFTFNATDVSSGTDVTLTAVGGGVTGDATVSIGDTAAGPGDLTDNGQAAQDLDGNGTFEDVNGDGQADTSDVTALFNVVTNQNLDSQTEQQLDINGDGSADTTDVTALFIEVTSN